jgi:ketosteroid isomerase-like protein
MQTVEQANLELVESLLSAFATGDQAAVHDLLTADVRFHFPGRNTLAGEYKGVDQCLSLLARISEWTGQSTRVRLHDAMANEQHGVLLYTVTASRGDTAITYRYMDIYHFAEGRISEVWGHVVDDIREFDRFYSG